jgi:hypothetical protein
VPPQCTACSPTSVGIAGAPQRCHCHRSRGTHRRTSCHHLHSHHHSCCRWSSTTRCPHPDSTRPCVEHVVQVSAQRSGCNLAGRVGIAPPCASASTTWTCSSSNHLSHYAMPISSSLAISLVAMAAVYCHHCWTSAFSLCTCNTILCSASMCRSLSPYI